MMYAYTKLTTLNTNSTIPKTRSCIHFFIAHLSSVVLYDISGNFLPCRYPDVFLESFSKTVRSMNIRPGEPIVCGVTDST